VATPKQQRLDPKRIEQARAKTGKSGRPGGRPPGAPAIKKATARDWIGGARLLTLPLGIAPVLLGTAAAWVQPGGAGHWVRALLCLAVACSLQIGVNFANDYSDGLRGTDRRRVGPSRLTGSGAAKPRAVLTVALVFFALAAAAGAVLVLRTGQYLLLAVGAACILAGWFYTGGKRPYGYYGLGELFVFVFFGLVATVGTTFVQLGSITIESWLSGIAIGFIACAVLMVNNIRDRDNDKAARKRTLAVLIGDRASRVTFVVLVLLPFVVLYFFVIFYANAGYTYFALFAAGTASVITLTAKTPQEFVIALRLTTLTALAFGVLLGWAIAF
jgi:1,4-dihydroxy-2-naphthoate polyprenyltransferase